ncbi:PREDICTED: U-box domain-containing protein 11-like isoform X2 [Populus euphratica]|uniref:RING-type E3 ubiquitin transferase n=1 Tax=Populus euphratica TaxID=75702 RepID=A0AAJ6U5E4_POPEU|nr:PREDICTED: U-box domain-containing protein 11-like isoform X2 [Populus euphratica]
MAGGEDNLVTAAFLLDLVRQICSVGISVAGDKNKKDSVFRKDCMDLVRRVSLLTHFLEEINGQLGKLDALGSSSSSSKEMNWWSDLVAALQSAHNLLSLAGSFQSTNNSDGTGKNIVTLFHGVTWKLENSLANVPYDQFDISEEVQEQVALVRAQLRRATERYGSVNSREVSLPFSQQIDKDVDQAQKGTSVNHKVAENIETSVSGSNGSTDRTADLVASESNAVDLAKKYSLPNKSTKDLKKPDTLKIPHDFLCPISLELMRDPVIVATGQTYERSYIQRWIDTDNSTCPKTQQKLEHLTLTPNYVLRSLITQWCTEHKVEQPTGLANGRIKKSDGSFRDVSGDMAAIQATVRRLSSRSIEERRAAVSEIRSLSKRSTDNRILLAGAGAIPVLVSLLISEDTSIQENTVTSILNLSIYEDNKGLIMLAGAVPSIVQVLRTGSVEARENAAATLFSLSLADENKIIIGASGAIPALVELLENGSTRGKKDAATALFNLCIYQGNKGRAVRAGIITALLNMLTDSRNRMIDEALTILSVLASNQEAKVAIVKASTLPVLIDLLRTGGPRNKESAAAILLSLCKRDSENLACVSRLGAVIPLTELAKGGTERAKRKATSMLEHLRRLQQH